MYDFGLTHEQFLDLTFAKFAALSKRHDRRVLHEEHGPALITCYLANLFHDKKKGAPPRVEDFMLHGECVEVEPISREELRKKIAAAIPRKGKRSQPETRKGG